MTWMWKQQDKMKHFMGGFLAAFFIALFTEAFVAFAIITAVGFAKEESDRRDPQHHTEEARDAMATSLGGFVGAMLGEASRSLIWRVF